MANSSVVKEQCYFSGQIFYFFICYNVALEQLLFTEGDKLCNTVDYSLYPVGVRSTTYTLVGRGPVALE